MLVWYFEEGCTVLYFYNQIDLARLFAPEDASATATNGNRLGLWIPPNPEQEIESVEIYSTLKKYVLFIKSFVST